MNNRFDRLLYKYRESVAYDSKRARKYIQQLNYKNNFYLLQCIAQTYLDESRFEEGSKKMRKEINFRKWRMAEKYIIAAFEIDSANAEVLYTMASVRRSNFQNDIAIYCYKKLIKIGVNKISNQKYSRGKEFARELVNDAKFELYRLYYYENPKLSRKYLNNFKNGLSKGIATIYEPVKKFLIN